MGTNKKSNLKKCICLGLVCVFGLTACTSSKDTTSNDILTLKKTEDGRTQITIMVKHAFSINSFEKVVEEKFPDIDIIQVGNYTANTTLAKEYDTRLKHNDLTDIVMTWPLEVGEEYWADQLIDLSGMSFTNKYKKSMLDNIATNSGSLYYLPGPATIRGIIYNKTMFEEYGWQVPGNYTDFLALCKTIEASGMRSLQLPLGNAEVLDTAFIGFNYGNAYSKPKDTAWLSEYDQGKGNFIDHFESSLNTFQELIDSGVLQNSDLNLYYQDTQRNLFDRKTAMIEDSALLAKLGNAYGNTEDEFALMPFFNKEPENDWARIYMTCYIGLNKELEDSNNKEKYDKVIKLMEYISTPDGQLALSSDSGAMYSSLKGVKVPAYDAIKDMVTALEEGRYGVFPTLKRSQSVLRKGLAAMVKGEMNSLQVASLVDQDNKTPAAKDNVEVYGKGTKDFTLIETGSFVTDILKEECDSDFALFLDNGKDGLNSGKGIGAKIYQGDFTDVDLKRIFPDLSHGENGELWKVTMTGENLIKTLEYSMEVDGDSGWFYYFSGLKVEFNPLEKPGSRIKSITTFDGKEIDKGKEYSIAVMEQSIPEGYIISCQKTGKLIQDLIKEKVQKEKTISPAKDNRFVIVNQ